RLGDLGQAAEGPAIPGEALLEDHDPLKLALPLSNQQRPGLQADAFSRLRRAPVKRSDRVIVLLGAKDPLDRFVEAAERVRLEPIGQHPRSQRGRWAGASPPKWARHWRRNPLRSQPSRSATIDITAASSGGEEFDVAAIRRFASCPGLACAQATPITPLVSPSA